MMTWFKNLKVGSKLLISFILVLVIAVGVGIYLLVSMRDIDDSYSEAMILSEHRIAYIFEIKDAFTSVRTTLREIFYPENTREDLVRLSGQLDTSLDKMTYNLEELHAIAAGAVQSTIDTVLPQVQLYRDEGQAIIRSMLAVEDISFDNREYRDCLDAAEAEIRRMGRDYANEMTENIVDMSTLALKVFEKLIDENNAKADQAFLLSIIMLVIMAVVALFVAIVIPRMITNPLLPLVTFMKKASTTGDLTLTDADVNVIGKYAQLHDEIGMVIGACAAFISRVTDVSHALETIAGGDLTVDVETLSDADTMGGSLVRMVDNLNHMFGEIHNATTQVSTGSKQIANGAQALAQGSTEQAASVQQLSASIGDIARKTKDNAELAGRAAALANTIKNNAEKGSHQMDEMTTAVKEINQASQSISKVIKVIDDIAFQTNILALNAAVEAARAGQHGKGFAVVAEEVRNLAAKSAEAAKDTGGLIANSMEKAELGSRIAGETAESLTEIVSGINESSNIVSEIAMSSNEQSSEIEQINIGIDQVAQVIQQNSATAEESAAASEEMSGQSNILEDMISQFKLKNNDSKRFGPTAYEKKSLAQENPPLCSDGTGDYGKY